MRKHVPSTEPTQLKFFGMLSEAYMFFVQAQIELAMGRFENAVSAVERAVQIDPHNIEVSVFLNNTRLVGRARTRGNDLFKSERYTEACAAYGEGLRLDSSNSVLYCNRAVCWYKLGQWKKSVDNYNQVLSFQPNYTKALLRRSSSNTKLERWAEAVRDYEVLRKELPYDNEVAESLFHAQVVLKKSRGEKVHSMKFGGEVELVSGLEQFRAVISSPFASVVHFKATSNLQCKQISPFLDTSTTKYPSINFLKVDVEESPAIANAENVKIVPTFKIYKKGSRVKDMISKSRGVEIVGVRSCYVEGKHTAETLTMDYHRGAGVEKKQRAKIKEKLDKCVKENLLIFWDILNIPVMRSAAKKHELSVKLLDFLESPHSTTDLLLAKKEQVQLILYLLLPLFYDVAFFYDVVTSLCDFWEWELFLSNSIYLTGLNLI